MSFTVCRPEAFGVSSAGVLRFLDDLERRGLQQHSVCVRRHGEIVLQYTWAPYHEEQPHMLYSLTKGFLSAAAGLALEEGKLSLDTPVLPLLRNDVSSSAAGTEQITVRHLLTMTAGFAPETDRAPGEKENWAERMLSVPLTHEPGSCFHYNSMSSYILSLVIQRAVGEPVVDYLQPRLFDSLGIKKPRWAASPQGGSLGGTGLYLTAEQVSRFGQLLLDNGVYRGQRVLPEAYLREARKPQADSSRHGHGPDWTNGYGYQMWPSLYGRFRADGMNGQVCLAAPDKDAVIAVTAGLPNLASHMEALHAFLNDAFDDAPSPEDIRRSLRERLKTLSEPLPEGRGCLPEALAGAYQNAEGETLILSAEGETLTVQWDGHALCAGRGAYREAVFENPAFLIRTQAPLLQPETYAAAYGLHGKTLDMTTRFLTYSYTRYDRFDFDDAGLTHTQSGVRVDSKKERFVKI
ncbi:MAG: serine hydrolase [Clostridia bacterium]|nr:serine hydrolase [Clostridia bacterium]